ncbi:MAG: hydantoinase/oxoprolinase family protein [Thermodesulfobacteriota bacterium]|nr:hydantoinase/oxoprolinase family protein [Thermodesulfobacteriota bacterium]
MEAFYETVKIVCSTINDIIQHMENPRTDKPRYLLGIDTGGTFTDGVLLDYRTREIISAAKTLTTYGDLAEGVTSVLASLDITAPECIELVGISSTLATNSVAEGKTRKTGLILIGYDADLVAGYGLGDNFVAHMTAYFSGGHTSQGEEQAPLDLDSITAWVEDNKDELEALAVSSYFSPLNASHENRVYDAVSHISDLPIVLGHQLSTQLDSIKRAATACLNASLVAVMHEFAAAVQAALNQRDIKAPLMVVKGNGSLMPHTEAIRKPVETVLSGPAASAIGGRFFSDEKNALVIDVGGTTTDMALMQKGGVSISEEGARVGDIKTAVRAARIRTAVIGCDSRIGLNADKELIIGPERVVPLSRLAADFPSVRETFAELTKRRGYIWKPTDMVYWFLSKPVAPEDLGDFPATIRRLFRHLENTPLPLTTILKEAGVHHEVQLNADVLLQQGYIGVATLTPTDLLHAGGEMTNWCGQTATMALTCMCCLCNREPEEFIATTLDRIVATMTEEAMVFLAREKQRHLPERIDGQWGKWFFGQSLAGGGALLSVRIASAVPVIGIGAPAGFFVKRVAEALNAPFILPEHADVANAAGAVVGMVMVEVEALVYVKEFGEIRKFIVQAEIGNTEFKEEKAACEYARRTVTDRARENCLASGANNPQVTMKETTEGPLRRITAFAVGTPGLDTVEDGKPAVSG